MCGVFSRGVGLVCVVVVRVCACARAIFCSPSEKDRERARETNGGTKRAKEEQQNAGTGLSRHPHHCPTLYLSLQLSLSPLLEGGKCSPRDTLHTLAFSF